ncbi:3-hydroxyacyl-ACP dehydratase FabZ [Agrilactobacillus fermenti]|uniref:3-hydroxyacyl-ACP dehydratase FabZ n=1 Tax=Agrilactobacillus fermenti TaxID=2586909 RepID=UPI001E36FE36|nr:3-hydroxyacyl-ACP dehydratase FabZ [Agrilactobacillus fermenti]MCD2255702.1 3-hydroxyacyl-ACP dehydratase FabZ [Agrilactobacillus fermenti]
MAEVELDIKKILPHRYPMLLIDKVIDVQPGKSCQAIKNITNNEAVVQDYADGIARYPQMLMVESMAQAGAVALLSLPEFKGRIAFFGGIEKASFNGWAYPGDTLELAVELTKLKQNAGIGEGRVMVAGKEICTATLTFLVS